MSIPDINNVNLAIINTYECTDPCDVFLFITAKGILEHWTESGNVRNVFF